MTAAVGRAAGAVRTGAVTQAERDTLARKLAAAQDNGGGKLSQAPGAVAISGGRAAGTVRAKPPTQKAAPPPRTGAKPPPPRPQPAQPAAAPAPSTPRPSTAPTGRRWPALPGSSGVVHNGAGFVLGLLFWGWIALPMLRGGPTAVRDLWRAKWFNKAPDGSWLP